MIQDVRAAKDRIVYLFDALDREKDRINLRIQGVFANHLALKAAGFVEKSVQLELADYARRHGNSQVSKYVLRTIEWENSLNCEKIEKILSQLDPTWWGKLADELSEENLSAMNSLKNIRDQLAHGGDNGTQILSSDDILNRPSLLSRKCRNFWLTDWC